MSETSTIDADPDTKIAEISGMLNVEHARLIQVVAHALGEGGWVGDGIQTPAQWVALRAGVSPARAKLIVRVAEQRGSFPLVFEAFEAGELTLDQVAEVVKAPAWADEQVVDFAKPFGTTPGNQRSATVSGPGNAHVEVAGTARDPRQGARRCES